MKDVSRRIRNTLSEISLSGTELLNLIVEFKELAAYHDEVEDLQKQVERLEDELEAERKRR